MASSTSVRAAWRMLITAVVMVLLAGCAVSTEIGSPTPSPQGGTADPETPPDVPEPVAREMTSAEVYEAVSASIVFLETSDLSTGSGIVIDGGWIVTNAHIVDRIPTVRIGRSDGVDIGEYPVAAIDWLMDLALVGPVDDATLAAMPRVSSADLAIGDRVLLLGFPDESSVRPTPTLTEGIVSRRRRPALGKFPFVQVDATIAPGQSGGALIDGAGNLVGISGLQFGEGEFALAFEADAMWPRVDMMLQAAQEPVTPPDVVETVVDDVGVYRTIGLIVETDELGHIEVNAAGEDDLFIDLQSLGGVTVSTSAEFDDVFELRNEDTFYYIDDFIEGGEQLVADVEPGTYQVVIGSFADVAGEVEVSSPNELRQHSDVEEASTIPVGVVVEGQIDWSRDSDRWQLPLTAGDSVTIVTDGIADTILAVRLGGVAVVSSDDEGLGLFGTGSMVEFVAESDGVYEIEVGSFDTTRWGYLIEVTVN